MPSPTVTLRLMPETLSEIDARAERNPDDARQTYGRTSAAGKALDRYYAILAYGRRELRKTLSQEHVSYMADMLNGTMFEPAAMVPHGLVIELQDDLELNPERCEKWKVNGGDLLAAIRELSTAGAYALADCVERWWTRVSRGENPGLNEILSEPKGAE